MSDVVLVALLGFIATVGGSIGATTVAGVMQRHSTKLQLTAQRDVLQQQLDHQRQEARIDRLVEARKGHLIPLRQVVARWLLSANAMVSAVGRMQVANRTKEPQRYKEEWENLNARMDESEKISSELEELRAQISDDTLDDLIEAAFKSSKETELERLQLVQRFNEANEPIESLEKAFEDYTSILQRIRAKLRVVNRRIDELLADE